MSYKSLLTYYLKCLEYESYHDVRLTKRNVEDGLINDLSFNHDRPKILEKVKNNKTDKEETLYVGYPCIFYKKSYLPLSLWEFSSEDDVRPDDELFFHRILYQFFSTELDFLDQIKTNVLDKGKDIFKQKEKFASIIDELEVDSQEVIWQPVIFFSNRKVPANYYIMNEIEKMIKGREKISPVMQSYFSNDHSEIKSNDHLYHIVLSNQPQNQALQNISEQVTVIQGPPGTGKTQTILNLIANSVINNENILIASTNNQAVDNITEKFEKEGLNKLFPGLARFGKRDIVETTAQQLLNVLESLADDEKLKSLDMKELHVEYEKFKMQSREFGHKISHIENENVRYDELTKEKESLTTLIKQIKNRIQQNGMNDYINEFKETPKMEKIERVLSDILYSWSENKEKNILQNWIEKVLSWVLKTPHPTLKRQIFKLRKPVAEKIWDDLDENDPIPSLAKLHDIFRYLNIKNNIEKISEQLSGVDKQKNDQLLSDYYNRKIKSDRQLLNLNWKIRIKEILEEGEYSKVKDCIQSLAQNKKLTRNEMNLFHSFLKVFPITLTSNLSARRTIPPGFKYDLVIIDEASQCSIPSTVSLLQSAKKICLIGDQKQLSHITSVDKEDNEKLWKKHVSGLNLIKYDYCNVSAFDRAVYATEHDQRKQHMLTYHYRCAPSIINFSNKTFYSNKLIIKTKEPDSGYFKGGVHFEDADGIFEDNFNEREAKKVVDITNDLIQNGIKNIGVVTPFRRQKNYLVRNLPSDVKVGTIHTFQGGECEAIVLSPVIAEGVKNHHIHFVQNNAQMINVAVTRAIHSLIVVGSKNTILSNDGYLKSLLKYIEEIKDVQVLPSIMKCLSNEQLLRRRKLLNDTEKRIYHSIEKIVLEYPLIVQPKISVKDTIFIKQQLETDFYRYYLMAHFDFVVYDKATLIPVMAVEYDGPYHESNKAIKNDRRKNNLCDMSDFPLVRISYKDEQQGFNDVREKLSQVFR